MLLVPVSALSVSVPAGPIRTFLGLTRRFHVNVRSSALTTSCNTLRNAKRMNTSFMHESQGRREDQRETGTATLMTANSIQVMLER